MRSESPVPLVLLGVPVHNLGAEEAVERILRDADERRPCHVVTSNLDFLRLCRHDPELHRIHLDADLVVPDGMPLLWLSRLFGPPLKERVTGSDMVPRLAERAREDGLSVFAVGGAPGVAERALGVLRERFPGLSVRGCVSPPVAPLLQMEPEELRRLLREAAPHIVFVALGSPKQEKWIRLFRSEAALPVAVGIGGSLDFLAGVQVRAPRAFQRLGLEWLWRLLGSPRRLLGRYARDLAFLAGMLARVALLRLSPPGPAPDGPAPDEARLAGLGAVRAVLTRLDGPEAAAAFVAGVERLRRGGCVVLDLAGAAWLDSLELGVLVRVARECLDDGGRLVVTGAAPRARRLLRLFRLDRFLDIADDAEALNLLLGPAGPVRLRRAGPRLRVELCREFGAAEARRFGPDILREWRSGGVAEVVVDASRVEYVDVAGARFLLAFQRDVEASGEGSVWLLDCPPAVFERLRKEGHDLARRDRRRRFRTARTLAPGAGGRR